MHNIGIAILSVLTIISIVLNIMNLSIKVKDKLLRDDEFSTMKTDLKNYRLLVSKLHTPTPINNSEFANTVLHDPFDNCLQ